LDTIVLTEKKSNLVASSLVLVVEDDHELAENIRLELQADYFAGVWAHYAQEQFNFLEPGDIESALNAANQIGDDKLQTSARAP